MKGWWAVTLRDLGEWRLFYLLSFVLGGLPILLTLLPSVSGYSKAEVRASSVVLILLLFGLLAPLALGSSLVARDLAERRAGFYFSRPIGAWGLWSGKLLAGWLVVCLGIALVLLPTAAVDLLSGADSRLTDVLLGAGSRSATPLLALGEAGVYHDRSGAADWPAALGIGARWLAALAVPLVLILLAHVAAVAWRARSAWLILDLIGLVATVVGGVLVVDQLLTAQALGGLFVVERFWGLWLVVALVVAGGLQIGFGRADLLRAHRVMASVLWPLLLVGVLGAAVYARWLVSPGLETIEHRSVEAAPAGDWLYVEGFARGRFGYRPSFLLDTASGRSVALGSVGVSYLGFRFADEGRAAAWIACRRLARPDCEVKWLALDAPGAEPIATGVEVGRLGSPLTLSADGRRLALCQGQQLSVLELPTGRLLGSTRLELSQGECPHDLAFVSPDVVRFHLMSGSGRDGGRKAATWRFDAKNRELRQIWEVDASWIHQAMRDPYRGHVLDVFVPPTARWLVDGETEEVLWRREEGPRLHWPWTRFLADGRLVSARRSDEGVWVAVISPTGELEREVLLAGVAEIILGYEVAPNRLAIGISDTSIASHPVPVSVARWTTETLDVASGERQKVLEGAYPLATGWHQQPRLGVAAARLFLDADGAVFRWDSATGERRVVLGAAG